MGPTCELASRGREIHMGRQSKGEIGTEEGSGLLTQSSRVNRFHLNQFTMVWLREVRYAGQFKCLRALLQH